VDSALAKPVWITGTGGIADYSEVILVMESCWPKLMAAQDGTVLATRHAS